MAVAPKSGLIIAGAVIAVLGCVAFAVPVFTTEKTRDVAQIGDLKLTANQETAHIIPPYTGPVALGVGIILIGIGLTKRA